MISDPNKPLHRLREERLRAGLSIRSIARRTGLPMSTVREHEESENLSLRDLAMWQQALGVPFGDLLASPPGALSDPVQLRAGLVQITKSLHSLQETELTEQQVAHVSNILHRLRGLMPELDEIQAWPQRGSGKRTDEPSQVEMRLLDTHTWCPELAPNRQVG